jgi:hypothetical protein
MALSMDEQRVLAEIERRLAADDPGLATCLTSFRRPGPATVLRSPRARIVGSLFTVLLVAMVSLMVYAMIPFRTHVRTPSPSSPSSSSTVTTEAAPTSPVNANASVGGAGTRSSGASAAPSASAGNGHGTGGQAEGQTKPPGGP